jgi:catechol 1,2-dioxygenase
MTSTLLGRPEIQQLLGRVSGMTGPGGNDRTKHIVRRIVSDLYATIDEFDVTPEEFWSALSFLQHGAAEFGLITPGLGFDRLLDIRMDEKDKAAGVGGGTPRTIEGPLYVHGAPLSKGFARLDDGTEQGEVLVVHGRVLDPKGKPLAGAIVDVWQANTRGNYSHFDPAQSTYNNRRRIETDAAGRYRFRSMMPSGYAVPPRGATERLLTMLGRHGKRPAHIHFFVSAPAHRHLTTQLNIADDPLVHDDFAHATREGLIPGIVRRATTAAGPGKEPGEPYAEIEFDFTLQPARDASEAAMPARPRVPAIG